MEGANKGDSTSESGCWVWELIPLEPLDDNSSGQNTDTVTNNIEYHCKKET